MNTHHYAVVQIIECTTPRANPELDKRGLEWWGGVSTVLSVVTNTPLGLGPRQWARLCARRGSEDGQSHTLYSVLLWTWNYSKKSLFLKFVLINVCFFLFKNSRGNTPLLSLVHCDLMLIKHVASMSYGDHDQVAQIGWLKRQKCIVSVPEAGNPGSRCRWSWCHVTTTAVFGIPSLWFHVHVAFPLCTYFCFQISPLNKDANHTGCRAHTT